MDVESRLTSIEITVAELRKDVDELRADHDDIRTVTIELAVMKQDLGYIKSAQERLNANANKVIMVVIGAVIAQFIGFALAGGLAIT